MDIILELLSIVLLSFALLFNIISLSTPGWIYFPADAYPDDFPNGVAQGLFEGMYGVTSTTVIRSTAENTAFALDILAEFALLFAIALCIMIRFGKTKEGDRLLEFVKVALVLVAALFIMIGMAVYTNVHSPSKKKYGASWGYSYVFGWFSFCLALLGGLVAAYRLEEIRSLLRRNNDE